MPDYMVRRLSNNDVEFFTDTPPFTRPWPGPAGEDYQIVDLTNGENISVDDTVAPVLSSPTDAANGGAASTASVSTDESNGTLYVVVTTSATAPSAAQVAAGQDHTGSAAAFAANQAVSAVGVQTITPPPSGLTAETGYFTHFMHEDAATNRSAVVSAAGFTTPVLSNTVGVPTPISTQGDSWSVRSAGQIANTDYTSTSTSRGSGGSLMTDAITRWQSDVVNFPNQIHFFLDGIYDDYSDEATFITNLNNIATAANNAGVTWFFIGSGHPQPGGAEYPGDTIALEVLALTDTALGLYPNNVLDLRTILQPLNDGSPDDLADVAAGLLPRSIYSDTLHVGNGGDLAIGQLIADTAEANWPQVAQHVPSDTPANLLGVNLIADLDPSAGGMLQTTGGAAAAADGDLIQVIPDQAGGADWVAPVLGERATLRFEDSLPYIDTDGAFLERSLSRSGDIYLCAAVRGYTGGGGGNIITKLLDDTTFNGYEFKRWGFAVEGWAVQGTNIDLQAPADTGEIMIVEWVVSSTTQEIKVRRAQRFVETTSSGTPEARAATNIERIAALNTGETFGQLDLWRYVMASTIPTDAVRDDIIHTVAASAGIVLLPPGSEDG